MGILHDSVVERKSSIINQLLNLGKYKMADGRQLYEVPLTDLEQELKQYEN